MISSVLCFNLNEKRLNALKAAADACSLSVQPVFPSDFSQTLAAVAGLEEKRPSLPPAAFSGEMLVLVNLSSIQCDRLLSQLPLHLNPPVRLKAALTPTNSRWSCAKLYQEIAMEDAMMRMSSQIQKP